MVLSLVQGLRFSFGLAMPVELRARFAIASQYALSFGKAVFDVWE